MVKISCRKIVATSNMLITLYYIIFIFMAHVIAPSQQNHIEENAFMNIMILSAAQYLSFS